MRRPSRSFNPVQRLLALLLTVLLLSGIGVDAYALDPCSHHSLALPSGDTSSSANTGSSANMGSSPGAHAAHGGHDAAPTGHTDAATAQQGAEESGHGGACTCMGACTTAAAIAVPHASSLTMGGEHQVAVPIVSPSPDATASLHLALLPYSIAPPAAPSSIQV